MKTLLVGGHFHKVLQPHCNNILNHNMLFLNETVSFLAQTPLAFDQIVILDDGVVGNDIFRIQSDLKDLHSFLEREKTKCDIILLTNSIQLSGIQSQNIRITHLLTVRISFTSYTEIIDASSNKPKRESVVKSIPEFSEIAPSKPRLLDRFKQKKEADQPLSQTDVIAKGFDNISRSLSRTIAITGHHGSGVTSTAVNLAQIATQRKLSTILVDLDTDNRSVNLYFGGFYEQAEKQEEIACSLIRNLAKPQDYKLNSYRQGDLYVSTLAYSVREPKMLEQVFTAQKLITMVSVYKQKFNICLLDFPLDVFKQLPQAFVHIDAIGMCVSNNLYSISTTLRNTENSFGPDDIGIFNAKAKIIVSKYIDVSTFDEEFFTPDKVCDLLSTLSDTFALKFDLAGYVPFFDGFDGQIESDVPVVASNAHMEQAYSSILLRLLEGVR